MEQAQIYEPEQVRWNYWANYPSFPGIIPFKETESPHLETLFWNDFSETPEN